MDYSHSCFKGGLVRELGDIMVLNGHRRNSIGAGVLGRDGGFGLDAVENHGLVIILCNKIGLLGIVVIGLIAAEGVAAISP